MIYKRDDFVLVRFKRGFKLGRIVVRSADGWGIRIWNATGRKWSRPTFRRDSSIWGLASEQDKATYYYTKPHPFELSETESLEVKNV